MRKKSQSTAGADLVTTAKTLIGRTPRPFLPELGLSPREVEHMQSVATKILAMQDALRLVYSNVEASRPIIAAGSEMLNAGEIGALDAMLKLSASLQLSHRERQNYFLWGSRVFPAIRNASSDLDDVLPEAAVQVVRQAFDAYESNTRVVSTVLETADRKPQSDADQPDLEMLAAMIGIRAYLRFGARIGRGLSEAGLASFLEWASRVVGQPIRLPG